MSEIGPVGHSDDLNPFVFEAQLLACSKVVGEAFFPVMVKAVAETLKVRWVLVGTFSPDKEEEVRTIAAWDKNGLIPNFHYPLTGSPCENVRAQGPCGYPDRICALFPTDLLLSQMGAESYIGIPLRSSTGTTLGILAVLDDKPLPSLDRKRDILEIFAARASSELERVQSFSLTERLGRIVEESVSEAYIFDADTYKFELVNKGARDNLGYTMPELRELTPWDLKPEMSKEEFLSFVRPLKEQQIPSLFFETVHKRKDGSLYDVAVQLQYFAGLANVFYASITDITERKKAEEARAHLAAIVSNSSEAIISKSLDGTIRSWNVGATKLFGFSTEEMIGNTIRRLIPPERMNEEDQILDRIRAGLEMSNYETIRVRKDGSPLHVTVNVSPIINNGGKVIGASTIAHDITSRIEAQERERLLMAEVNHRAKNLLALVQVIARQTASSDPVSFAKRFEERIMALAASHDVLVQNNWTSVPLDKLISSQLRHMGSGDTKRIHLEGEDLEVNAAAAQAIGMALHELATNAAKYGALSSPTGDVHVSWKTEVSSDRGATFFMQWKERGGPPVQNPTRKGFGSTVIDRILRLRVDGEVTLDYAPTGLICSLKCPLDSLLESEVRTFGASRHPGNDQNANLADERRSRVLVVEDETILALQVAEVLEAADISVLGPVASVQAALNLLASERCDAALLDINLGHESSEAVARKLHASGIPFMTLSSYAVDERPSVFDSARHLDKPVRAETLLGEIQALLKKDTDAPVA